MCKSQLTESPKNPGRFTVPLMDLTVNFDVDEAVDQESETRQQFGAEVALRSFLFLRAGYVHDDLVVQGARDTTFGGGVRWSNGAFAAILDFARWPYYHDTYGSIFGLSILYEI